MTHDPIPTTDIYDFLRGEGFVMVGHDAPPLCKYPLPFAANPAQSHSVVLPDPIKSVELDIKELERLLR